MSRVLEIDASTAGIYENGKRLGSFHLIGCALFVDKKANMRSCYKLTLRDEHK